MELGIASPLRKEAVISLLFCFALSVKEFQQLQVGNHDFHFFFLPLLLLARGRAGG